MGKKNNKKKNAQKASAAAANAPAPVASEAKPVAEATEQSPKIATAGPVELKDDAKVVEPEQLLVETSTATVSTEATGVTETSFPVEPTPTAGVEISIPEGTEVEIHPPTDTPPALATPVPADVEIRTPPTASLTENPAQHPLASTTIAPSDNIAPPAHADVPNTTSESTSSRVESPPVDADFADVSVALNEAQVDSANTSGTANLEEVEQEVTYPVPEEVEEHIDQPVEKTPSAAPQTVDDLFGEDEAADDAFAGFSAPAELESEVAESEKEAAPEPVMHAPVATTITAGDLFGETEESDDPFAQVADAAPGPETASQPTLEHQPTSPRSPPPAPQRAPTVDDLFGGHDDGDDPFAQIQPAAEPEPEVREPITEPVQSQATAPPPESSIENLFGGQDESSDPFAQIVSPEVDAEPQPTLLNEVADKFSDLLAEFEDEVDPQAAEQPLSTSTDKQQPANDAFGDLMAEFEEQEKLEGAPADVEQDGRAQVDPSSQKDAAQSGINALFSSTSDFMVDTSFDDESFALQEGGSRRIPDSPQYDTSSSAAEPLEVPQGWYDEAGNWNWYTEQEKELVREAILAESTANSNRESNAILSMSKADVSRKIHAQRAIFRECGKARGSRSELSRRLFSLCAIAAYHERVVPVFGIHSIYLCPQRYTIFPLRSTEPIRTLCCGHKAVRSICASESQCSASEPLYTSNFDRSRIRSCPSAKSSHSSAERP